MGLSYTTDLAKGGERTLAAHPQLNRGSPEVEQPPPLQGMIKKGRTRSPPGTPKDMGSGKGFTTQRGHPHKVY